ncbi:MAG: hypothetical protein QF814_09940 [Candidatus Marinimicrobia bacterium]|nr:hypothetical protein [Candidatus Neomarinimicrobiota bacterium]
MMSCNSFNTENEKGALFSLTINHDITRITDSAFVYLNWDEISVLGFKRWVIERKKVEGSHWFKAGEINNRLMTKFRDVIFDDENLLYRVAIEDTSGNMKWAEGIIEIPNTKYLMVPEEQRTPKIAYESPLIDEGDSILVGPGEYHDALKMVGKNVLIESMEGFEKTILAHRVEMNDGTLKGFSIIDGVGAGKDNGGGIYAVGNATIRNCYVGQNKTGNHGGGIFLKDKASLFNSILYDNHSDVSNHNLFISNATGQVINNTFVLTDGVEGNNVTAYNLKSGFVFLNNIMLYGTTFALDTTITSHSSVIIDYSRMDSVSISGPNLIMDDPKLIRLDLTPSAFFLAKDSPCIHAGHPDDQYNNIDGLRNTMGATGGPEGK